MGKITGLLGEFNLKRRKKRNGFYKVQCKFCGSNSCWVKFDFKTEHPSNNEYSKRVIRVYECTLCSRYARQASGENNFTEITKQEYLECR